MCETRRNFMEQNQMKWQRLSDPDEIMKETEGLKTINKWKVLYYFGNSGLNPQVFENLIQSKYFSLGEIAYKYRFPQSRANVSRFFDEFLSSVDNHPMKDKFWRDLAPEIRAEFGDQTYTVSEKEIFERFSSRPEVLMRVANKVPYEFLKIASHEQLALSSSIEKCLAEHHSEIVDDFFRDVFSKYYKTEKNINPNQSNIERLKNRAERSVVLPDPKVFTRLGTKKVFEPIFRDILELDILTPTALDEKIPEKLKEKFSPLLKAYITGENTTGFSELFQKTLDLKRRRTEMARLARLQMLENERIRKLENERIQAEKEKQQAENRANFVDDDGNFKVLFSLAGLKPSSKSDYEKIAKKFLETNLSIPAFCKKYKISNTETFKEMLGELSKQDNEMGVMLKDKNRTSQQNFMQATFSFVNTVNDPNGDIQTAIQNNTSKDRTFAKILAMPETSIPASEKLEFVRRISTYFAERLLMDDKSYTLENISSRLTNNEISFLTSSETIQKMSSGATIDLGAEFASTIKPFKQELDMQTKNAFTRKVVYPIKSALVQYGTKFQPKKYLSANPGIGVADGSVVMITPEMVDTALYFAQKQGLYPCNTTISRIIKVVAEGQIKDAHEEVQKSEEKQNAFLQKLQNSQSIEEYFDSVERQ